MSANLSANENGESPEPLSGSRSNSPMPGHGTQNQPEPPCSPSLNHNRSRGPSPLPYPAADPMPGQTSTSFPPTSSSSANDTLKVPPPGPHFGQQLNHFAQPPAFHHMPNSRPPPMPMPTRHGNRQVHPVPQTGRPYPIGNQPYTMPPQYYPQAVVIGGSATAIHTNRGMKDRAIGAIVMSCVVTWCCGCILGIIAFALAMIAYKNAKNHRRSNGFSFASFIVSGVGLFVGLIALIVVLAVVLGSSNSCSYKIYDICYSNRLSISDNATCAIAGGFYNDNDTYCYFRSSEYSSYSGCSNRYYVSATNTCYNSRSTRVTYSYCTSINGYYISAYSHCYYSPYCPYTYVNGKCYRYSSRSTTSCYGSTTYRRSSYYSRYYRTCYYN